MNLDDKLDNKRTSLKKKKGRERRKEKEIFHDLLRNE